MIKSWQGFGQHFTENGWREREKNENMTGNVCKEYKKDVCWPERKVTMAQQELLSSYTFLKMSYLTLGFGRGLQFYSPISRTF